MLGKVLFTFHTPKTDNSFSNSPSHIIIDWHLQKENLSWKTKCPTIKKYSHGLREQNQHQNERNASTFDEIIGLPNDTSIKCILLPRLAIRF